MIINLKNAAGRKRAELAINKLPLNPGVYFFKDAQNKILYIGKAANLRARIKSYFAGTQSDKTQRLIQASRKLSLLPLESEIEALIKEAALIKKHRPKYNILFRDDKNYFYVVLTEERFPRIFTTHQPRRWQVGTPTKTSKPKRFRNWKFPPTSRLPPSPRLRWADRRADEIRNYRILGPFVSGRALKTTLRLLRKYFPYCTCPKPHHRICMQSQLNLCPGHCCRIGSNPLPTDIKRYKTETNRVAAILQGRRTTIYKILQKKITTLTKLKKFEEAAETRNQLRGLERIFAHRGALISLESNEITVTQEATPPLTALRGLQAVLGIKSFPLRIEFYDASMLSGTIPVGGMTSWHNGKADKSSWRLFHIKEIKNQKANDPGQISEMIVRRLKHREWNLPNLIIIDGGITQFNAASNAVSQAGLNIPVAAITKGKPQDDRLFWRKMTPTTSITAKENFKNIPLSTLPIDIARMLQQMRDATHHFALGYQRRKRRV